MAVVIGIRFCFNLFILHLVFINYHYVHVENCCYVVVIKFQIRQLILNINLTEENKMYWGNIPYNYVYISNHWSIIYNGSTGLSGKIANGRYAKTTRVNSEPHA